ncbi:hypothetical protein PDN17_23000 [Bacillus cereus]|nr:hypothetical protein [Bacillus cereus]
MERYDDMEVNEENGSTHTRGTYIISKDGDFFNIHMGIKVRKSGVEGTGHGTVFLVVETSDGQKYTFGPLEKTVGAKFPEGVNTDEGDHHYRTKLAFDDANEVVSWYLVVGANDNSVIPRSIEDVKTMVLENVEFMSKLAEIAAGKSSNINGLNVTRTGRR